MANYPVKLLKDKDGTAFVPVVNSDSIITPEGDTLNDLLEEKQDLLTSGTNIKTINNESLLGSGNISIQGGSGASAWGSITGTLSDQTDLQTELSNKASKSFYSDTTINVGRKRNTTVGTNSTAEGIDTTASGVASHAEGWDTTASGQSSHAEGEATEASGLWSHAEGNQTTAGGENSHAEGEATEASGDCSHAEGFQTTASGEISHAEGWTTTASGVYSHAEGENTVANSEAQHVFGRYNILDTNDDTTNYGTYVEIVGNGASRDARSNARTLDWSGNETLAGDSTVGGTVKATKGIWSRPTGEVGTATSDSNSCLLIKRANNTEAPNNGVVLEFGNSANWRGQLYIGDNATQGIWYNGWSDGVRGSWKRLADVPTKTTDANGWTVLQHNGYTEYFKTGTINVSYSKGPSWQNHTTTALPSGMTRNTANIFFSGGISKSDSALTATIGIANNSDNVVVADYWHYGSSINVTLKWWAKITKID